MQIFARILVLVCKTFTNYQHCSKQGVRDREPRNYIYPKESNFLSTMADELTTVILLCFLAFSTLKHVSSFVAVQHEKHPKQPPTQH